MITYESRLLNYLDKYLLTIITEVPKNVIFLSDFKKRRVYSEFDCTYIYTYIFYECLTNLLEIYMYRAYKANNPIRVLLASLFTIALYRTRSVRTHYH